MDGKTPKLYILHNNNNNNNDNDNNNKNDSKFVIFI